MRISVDASDPGYSPLARAEGVKILFDGAVTRDCITADEDRGLIVTYIRDHRGNLVTDNRGNLVKRTERGDVKITFPYRRS